MNKIFLFVAVAIVFGGAGYYIWMDLSASNSIDSDNTTSESSDGKKINIGGIAIEGGGDIKVEELPFEKSNRGVVNVPPPDLDKEIKITASLTKEVEQAAISKIIEISAKLKADKTLVNDWILLGVYRKIIGDYFGAAEVWEYAGKISPGAYMPFNNLGDLYAYYLKDSKKAEQNFQTAIKKGQNQIHIYRSFYEFYRYVVKNDTKAKAVLEQGIAANPGESSLDLQNLLQSF